MTNAIHSPTDTESNGTSHSGYRCNLAECLPAARQAGGHQLRVVGFREVHRFGCQHITVQGPVKGRR